MRSKLEAIVRDRLKIYMYVMIHLRKSLVTQLSVVHHGRRGGQEGSEGREYLLFRIR